MMYTETAYEIAENPHAFPNDMREGAIEFFTDMKLVALDHGDFNWFRFYRDKARAISASMKEAS